MTIERSPLFYVLGTGMNFRKRLNDLFIPVDKACLSEQYLNLHQEEKNKKYSLYHVIGLNRVRPIIKQNLNII